MLMGVGAGLEAQESKGRLALLMGNADYGDPKYNLANPKNDVNSMKNVLQRLGFEVMDCIDCTNRQMVETFRMFENRLRKEDFEATMFYYAGHGLRINGVNYMVPVDVEGLTESSVEFECVEVKRVLNVLEREQGSTNILVLDACLNNPFDKQATWRDLGGRLPDWAHTLPPSGTFAAYATEPGERSSDGLGDNGLYTSKLIKYLKVPNLSLEQVFKYTRKEVMEASDQKQVPWESNMTVGDFYFQRKLDATERDSDGDGLPDAYDNCPNEAGLKRLGGCPETAAANNGGDNNNSSRNDGRKGGVSQQETVSMPMSQEFPAPDMVLVRGGTFTMGATPEQGTCYGIAKVTNEMSVEDFYIGKYEVTYAQFKAFVDETGYVTTYEKPGKKGYIYKDGDWVEMEGVHWRHDRSGELLGMDDYDRPVAYMTWHDARAYCEWLSEKTGERFRLPAEVEWEFAARGGIKASVTTYAGSNEMNEVSWHIYNSQYKGMPVGKKAPNELGIYDMSGNVWEWCINAYRSYPSVDPSITPSDYNNRIFRGGSWRDSGEKTKINFRSNLPPDYTMSDLGFRVVKEVY